MKRSRRAWALAGLAGLGLLAGCTGGGPATTAAPAAPASPAGPGASSAAPPAPSSPASGSSGAALALASAAAAALKAGPSVHLDISTTISGKTITFSDDATASGGQQHMTLSGGGHVEIVYVGGVGYVRGNAQGLTGLMEVPPAQARSLDGRWIAVRPGEKLGGSDYSDITAGITLSSVASEMIPVGSLTVTGPTTVGGQRATGVRGSAPAAQQLPSSARVTVDVAAAAGSRPLRCVITAPGGFQSVATFSGWGEPLHLTAPPGAVTPAAPPAPPVLT